MEVKTNERCYLCKGDYSVCQKDAEAYYESIEAPDKAFYWIEMQVTVCFWITQRFIAIL